MINLPLRVLFSPLAKFRIAWSVIVFLTVFPCALYGQINVCPSLKHNILHQYSKLKKDSARLIAHLNRGIDYNDGLYVREQEKQNLLKTIYSQYSHPAQPLPQIVGPSLELASFESLLENNDEWFLPDFERKRRRHIKEEREKRNTALLTQYIEDQAEHDRMILEGVEIIRALELNPITKARRFAVRKAKERTLERENEYRSQEEQKATVLKAGTLIALISTLLVLTYIIWTRGNIWITHFYNWRKSSQSSAKYMKVGARWILIVLGLVAVFFLFHYTKYLVDEFTKEPKKIESGS